MSFWSWKTGIAGVVIVGAIGTATVYAVAQMGGENRGMHRMHGRMMQGQGGMQGGMHGGMMGQGMHGQMGPGMRGQMGPGMRHGGPGLAFTDTAQIETLKSELGIKPAQERAWTKYAKTLQDAAAAMKTTREGVDPDAVSKMSPTDRFAYVTKMREQGQKQFETVKTAADELLAALDEGQKAKARETLPGLAFGPGAMRAAGMGGPQHRHQGE